MEKDNNIDLIEQFLNGELDEDERNSVEKSIKDDPSFAEEVEMQRLLMDGIKYAGRKELHENLRAWDEEMSVNGNTGETATRTRSFKWYYLAASFSILLVAAAILLTNLETDYAQVSSTHFKPYDHLPSTTRGDKDDVHPLESIFLSYDRGDYNETITMIQALDPDHRSELTNFILANSLQATDKYEQAISLYEDLISSKGVYTFASEWYLSLCYLSMDQYDKAKPLLDGLADSSSSYSRNAKKLLKELH